MQKRNHGPCPICEGKGKLPLKYNLESTIARIALNMMKETVDRMWQDCLSLELFKGKTVGTKEEYLPLDLWLLMVNEFSKIQRARSDLRLPNARLLRSTKRRSRKEGS